MPKYLLLERSVEKNTTAGHRYRCVKLLAANVAWSRDEDFQAAVVSPKQHSLPNNVFTFSSTVSSKATKGFIELFSHLHSLFNSCKQTLICWIPTFNFRDLFFRFLLHDFLSKLDLCHLRHFLCLYKPNNYYLLLNFQNVISFIHLSLNCTLFFLTYHSFDPFCLCLLLHNLLCLLRDQQLCLLALPAK